MSRCEALSRLIPKNADCVLIEDPVSRRYFTDFPSSDGMLVVNEEYAVFGVDGRYIEAARQKIEGINVVGVGNYSEFLKDILKKLSVKTVCLEGKTSVSHLNALKRLCDNVDFLCNP